MATLHIKETTSTYILKDDLLNRTWGYVPKQFPHAEEMAAEIKKRHNAHDDLVVALYTHHRHCCNTQPGYNEYGDDAVAYRATRMALIKAGKIVVGAEGEPS